MTRRVLGKCALMVVAALVALGLAEGLHRGYLYVSGQAYSSAETEAQIRAITTAIGQTLDGDETDDPGGTTSTHGEVAALHPFFGYDLKLSSLAVGAEIEINRAAGADQFDILLLGGSVAEIFGNQGVLRFVELLEQDPRFADAKIHLVRFGRGGFKQPQQHAILSYLLSQGFVPDAVLNLDGYNEVAVTAHNFDRGVHPAHPYADPWLTLTSLGPGGAGDLVNYARIVSDRAVLAEAVDAELQRGLYHSSVLGKWTLARLQRMQSELQAKGEQYVASLAAGDKSATFGPPFSGDMRAAIETGVEIWGESSMLIHAICESRSIVYLHVLQPTLHDEGAKPMTAEERERGEARETWKHASLVGYPLLRKMGETLRERGVAFLDCSRIFAEIEEPLYVDPCHFDERGNRILAEEMARAFLEALPEQRIQPSARLMRSVLPERR